MDRNALVTILNRAPHIELPQILRPRDIVDAVLSRQDHFNPREKEGQGSYKLSHSSGQFRPHGSFKKKR